MIIRVMIAGQRSFIAHSFRSLCETEDDIYMAGRVSRVDELRFLLPHCDVALISAHLKGKETTDLIRDLHGRYQNVKLIIMGLPDVPAQIVQFFEAGAAGYILDTECTDDLLSKVRMAVKGKALVSDEVALFMMKRIHKLTKSQSGKEREQIAQLTPRQREVIELLAKGLTNREIANTLYIEHGTVKNHVHHILKKFNVSSRHEAASIYQERRTIRQGAAC